MLFWKPEVVQKASPVQRPYGQAAGDVVLSCEKWLPAVILGKKEQLSDLPHLASCGTWLSCKNPWSCKHFGATGMGQGLRASREPVGGRIWLGAPTVTWHSWYYRASSRGVALHWLSWSSLITGRFPYGLDCSWSGWSCSTQPSSWHCASHTWPEGVMDSFLWGLIVFLN